MNTNLVELLKEYEKICTDISNFKKLAKKMRKAAKINIYNGQNEEEIINKFKNNLHCHGINKENYNKLKKRKQEIIKKLAAEETKQNTTEIVKNKHLKIKAKTKL